MRKLITELPKNHDHLNQMNLRGDLEEEDTFGMYFNYRPGQIVCEDESGVVFVVYNYKYHTVSEFQEDCKILGLWDGGKPKVVTIGMQPSIDHHEVIKVMETIKATNHIQPDIHFGHTEPFIYKNTVQEVLPIVLTNDRYDIVEVKDGRELRRERRKKNRDNNK